MAKGRGCSVVLLRLEREPAHLRAHARRTATESKGEARQRVGSCWFRGAASAAASVSVLVSARAKSRVSRPTRVRSVDQRWPSGGRRGKLEALQRGQEVDWCLLYSSDKTGGQRTGRKCRGPTMAD
eukprot:2600288-Pleurochrysis_carterae.AAC.1